VARAISVNSLSSTFSSYVIYNIKLSIIPAPFSLSSSLKTFYISSPLIKDTVPFSLFASIHTKQFIIFKYPLLTQAQYYAYTTAFIFLSNKVMLLYSRYKRKGLVYIAIVALSGYQSFFILSVLN